MAIVDSTMLPRIAVPVVLITVCFVFVTGSQSLQQQTASACEIEMTEKRFMTCNGEKLPYTVNPSNNLPWDASVPPYTILLEPLYLSIIPQGGQYSANSDVYLSCMVSCYNEGKAGSDCPETNWAFANGSVITADDKYVINDTTLTVTGFSSMDEGEYICYVNNGSFSISSYPVLLALPKFTNWSMLVYDDPNEIQDEQTIDMTVSPFDAAILECSVEDADPAPSVVWSPKTDGQDQILLSNGNLLVKHLEKTKTFSCFNLIDGPSSQPKLLIYNVNVVSKDTQGIPLLVASPHSQTVISGSEVTLYCLFHSNSTVEYTWFRNGQPLPINTTDTLPYVMVINDVKESSSYECMGSNQYGNASSIAEITVIDIPYPTIKVLSSSVKYRMDNIDVALTDISGPVSLLLNCTLMEPMATQFRWLYKGQHVAGSAYQLLVNGSSIDEIIGSVQCFVDVLDTTGMGYLRIVKDKSNPPQNVVMTPSTNSPSVNIDWEPPSLRISYKYILELRTGEGKHIDIYQTETTTTCVRINMKVETYNVESGHGKADVRIQAIPSIYPTRFSDYLYRENRDISCHVPESPVLTHQKAELIGLTGRSFVYNLYFDNVSTSFGNIPEFSGVFDECDDFMYNDEYVVFTCCSYSNEKECTPEFNKGLISYNDSHLQMQCHQKCHWWAGLHKNDYNPAKVNSFITPDLPPGASGNITNVEWIGNKGTQLQLTMELPPMELSCFPTSLSIHCGADHEELDLQLHNLTMVFNRSSDSCWDPCSLYFTYNNSMGMSPPSMEISSPMPNKENIGGFHNLAYRGSEVITIEWALAEGMDCLLQKRYINRIVFNFARGGNDVDCSRISKWGDPYRLDNLTDTILVLNNTDLFNGGDACVRVAYALANDSDGLDSVKYTYTAMKHVPVHASHSSLLPGLGPTNSPLTPPSSVSNSYNQISTQLFLTTSLPTIGIIVILIFVMIVVGYFFYKRTKRRQGPSDEDRQQLMPDGSDILISSGPKDDETGTIVTKCEDLGSVKQERLECYLKDIEEFSNGDMRDDDHEIHENHSSIPNPRKHVEVEVELNHPVERSEDRIHKPERKKERRKKSGKTTVTATPRDNSSDMPSMSLLKDSETVRNAFHDVSKLLDDEYMQHPQEYPAVIAATGLNQSVGGAHIRTEGHELQEIANSHEKNHYEDMTTPIIDMTTPITTMTTPTGDQGKSLTLYQTLPPRPLNTNFNQVTAVTRKRPDSLSLTPLQIPSTSKPHYDISRSSHTANHMASNHMTSSHMISRPPPVIGSQPTVSGRNTSSVAVSSHTEYPSRAYNSDSSSSYLDNPFANSSLQLPLLPPPVRPQQITPIAVNTTTAQSTLTRTRQTSSRTSQTGYETVCNREDQPAQHPYFPTSPSRVSSGIGSPKSSGSFESVFDYQFDSSSKDMTNGRQPLRHCSDATSGINSPGVPSPAQVKTGAYNFPKLPPPLFMGGVDGYVGGVNKSVDNRSMDERMSENVFNQFNLSSQATSGCNQQRRMSLDQYLPNSTFNSAQSFAQLNPRLTTQPHPLNSSSYMTHPHATLSNNVPHPQVTLSSNMPRPCTSLSTSYVPNPPISPAKSCTSTGYLTPSTPLTSQPFTMSRRTSSSTPSPSQPYVVPSLLSSTQNISTNTLSVTMETPTVSDHAPSNSSDDFSESYSIGSDPSSMEDFKEKKSNDYIITEDNDSS